MTMIDVGFRGVLVSALIQYVLVYFSFALVDSQREKAVEKQIPLVDVFGFVANWILLLKFQWELDLGCLTVVPRIGKLFFSFVCFAAVAILISLTLTGAKLDSWKFRVVFWLFWFPLLLFSPIVILFFPENWTFAHVSLQVVLFLIAICTFHARILSSKNGTKLESEREKVSGDAAQ